jgi:hypothetical protein
MKIFENLDINDLDGEIWKDILDYEGDYQVSSIGRIKSFKYDKINGKIRKQYKDNDNYLTINLSKNGKKKTKKVHRLVYETFKEKLEEGYDAHHISENKEDNFVDNLEPKPHSEHSRDHNKGKIILEETRNKIRDYNKGKNHSEKTRKKMSENNLNRLSNQKYIDIKIDIKQGDLTQRQMASKHGVVHSTISKIKRRIKNEL